MSNPTQNTTDENLIPFAKAGRVIGTDPSIATLHRWRLKGVTAPDGSMVKLASIRVGGRRYVRRSDLDAFVAGLNPGIDTIPARTPSTRRRDAESAVARLARQGVK